MIPTSLRALTAAVAVAVMGGVVSSAQAPRPPASRPVERPQDRMERALGAILARSVAPLPKSGALPAQRTSFSDGDLNAWLGQPGNENVPVGMRAPTVQFTGAGTLTLAALIDIDAVRKSRERGAFDLLTYLGGVVQISMTGRLSGRGGQGTFDVDSASLGNVPVPKVLLQELISYYSKSPDYPDGIVLAKPFPLPARVREVMIARGLATVVQ